MEVFEVPGRGECREGVDQGVGTAGQRGKSSARTVIAEVDYQQVQSLGRGDVEQPLQPGRFGGRQGEAAVGEQEDPGGSELLGRRRSGLEDLVDEGVGREASIGGSIGQPRGQFGERRGVAGFCRHRDERGIEGGEGEGFPLRELSAKAGQEGGDPGGEVVRGHRGRAVDNGLEMQGLLRCHRGGERKAGHQEMQAVAALEGDDGEIEGGVGVGGGEGGEQTLQERPGGEGLRGGNDRAAGE